jgi:hypothetical protein
MSDAISYTPTARRNSEAAEAKADSAPLKAFETALLDVKAHAPARANAHAATPPAAPAPQVHGDRSGPSVSAKDNAAAKTGKNDEAGPRSTTGSTTTAIASGVQANSDSEATAKNTARSGKKASAKTEQVGTSAAAAAAAASGTADIAPPSSDAPDTSVAEGLAPTAALSSALSNGSAEEIKAALQTTLEGFADGTVPDAIKASLSKSGTAASPEIAVLLDSISVIAKDLLARGPLSELDFANSIDELFWVSNWFDLFNQSTAYDPTVPFSYSVNAAMALPMELFFNRAVMAPLTDAERVVSPGLASRRAVRANTDPVPGAGDLNNDDA